jgi:hypothetical protein
MNDKKIVLATLTQGGPIYRLVNDQMRDKWISQPRYNKEKGCHVQEWLTITNTDTNIHFFPNFPTPFLASTYLFLHNLEGITYA